MSVFTVLNPATEEPVTTVTQTSAEQADEAIVRAAEAQAAWRDVAPADRARLLRAMELLAEGRSNVTETAFACGFTNLSAFSKAFAGFTGQNPAVYRRERSNS